MYLCENCRYKNTERCPRNKDEESDRIKYELVDMKSRYVTLKLCAGLEGVLLKEVPEDERRKIMSYGVKFKY